MRCFILSCWTFYAVVVVVASPISQNPEDLSIDSHTILADDIDDSNNSGSILAAEIDDSSKSNDPKCLSDSFTDNSFDKNYSTYKSNLVVRQSCPSGFIQPPKPVSNTPMPGKSLGMPLNGTPSDDSHDSCIIEGYFMPVTCAGPEIPVAPAIVYKVPSFALAAVVNCVRGKFHVL